MNKKTQNEILEEARKKFEFGYSLSEEINKTIANKIQEWQKQGRHKDDIFIAMQSCLALVISDIFDTCYEVMPTKSYEKLVTDFVDLIITRDKAQLFSTSTNEASEQ